MLFLRPVCTRDWVLAHQNQYTPASMIRPLLSARGTKANHGLSGVGLSFGVQRGNNAPQIVLADLQCLYGRTEGDDV